MTRKKHMCVNYKYIFFLKYFLSQEQLTVLIEPKTIVRTTLFLLAILVTGPAQSPMWAVKLVHLRTDRALARENCIQFSIFTVMHSFSSNLLIFYWSFLYG